FKAPAGQYFYLDHDQRVTLITGAQLALPAKSWTSINVVYGSGFLMGNGPEHMPQHTTVDLAVGKALTSALSVRLSALNVGNALYLTGLDNAFAGTHYAAPREVTVQINYTYHR